MTSQRWVVRDRYGNEIYMTQERWEHALEHEDMEEWLLDHVLLTLRAGKRKQESLDPTKYRYSKLFDTLPGGNERLVVVVKFGVVFDLSGQSRQNNFVLTAYTV